MTTLPLCIQYLSALATPIIALMVAAIAFLQWRTANQNVVLQLFERRMAMVSELRAIVAQILQEGHVGNDDGFRFLRATRDAEFIFGPEVKVYLDRIYNVLGDLYVCDVEIEAAEGTDRTEQFQKQRHLRNELEAFFPKITELAIPYMRMRQKLIWH